MMAESNPMVFRWSIVVVAKEERTMVEGRCDLQDEDHDGHHVPRLVPGCHKSEHSFHAERCLRKVTTEWCAWQNEN